jgi:hypothetical protein
VWGQEFILPFVESKHADDSVFKIRGVTPYQLYCNAFTALCFNFPELLPFFQKTVEISSVDDLVFALNNLLALADQQQGCPFKAVSFHGNITRMDAEILEWEMRIDSHPPQSSARQRKSPKQLR